MPESKKNLTLYNSEMLFIQKARVSQYLELQPESQSDSIAKEGAKKPQPKSQKTYNQSCINSQRARTTAKELESESQSELIASARAKEPEPES